MQNCITNPRRPLRANGLFAGVFPACLVAAGYFVLPAAWPLWILFSGLVLAFCRLSLWPGTGAAALAAGLAWYPPAQAVDWSGVPAPTPFTAAAILAAAYLAGLTAKRLKTAAILQHAAQPHSADMLEQLTESICRFRADGSITYVNDAYCRMLGRSREELLGKPWQCSIWAEDLPQVERSLQKLSATEPLLDSEHRIVDAAGRVRWGEFVKQAFFGEDGTLLEVQSVGRDISERKALEERLQASANEIEDLYEHAPCGYHSVDKDGVILRINTTALSWLGCRREDVVGKMKITAFYNEEGKVLFRDAFPRFIAEGRIEDLEFELHGKNGEIRHVSLCATAIRDATGGFLMSRAVMYDITELKNTQNRLQKLMLEQQAMLDNQLIGMVKLKGRQVLWKNRAMDAICGYGPELVGQSSRVLYKSEEEFLALTAAADPVLAANGLFRHQVEMVRKDGEIIWTDISGMQLSADDGQSLWMVSDITATKKHQEEIERIAYHDILTGLPNRLLVEDRLQQALAQAARSNHLIAVCYLDLDGFKPVNDKFGHMAGDRLLREIAKRMQKTVRALDTVGRLGGDEFVLVLTHLENVAEYRAVLQRVTKVIGTPVELDQDNRVAIGASIGVAMFPTDSEDPDILMRHADQAMYRAKKAGRNRVCRFGDDHTAECG